MRGAGCGPRRAAAGSPSLERVPTTVHTQRQHRRKATMPVETCSKELLEGGQGSPIRIPPSVPSFRVVLCTGTAVCCGGTRAGKSECGRSSEVSATAGFGELRRTRVPWGLGGAKSGLKRGLSSVKCGARSHGTRHEQADRLGPRPTEPCAEPFSRFVPRAMDTNRMVSGQGRICAYIYIR